MLWWMWLLLSFAIACVLALWIARGRKDADDPVLADRADRAADQTRYNWLQ